MEISNNTPKPSPFQETHMGGNEVFFSQFSPPMEDPKMRKEFLDNLYNATNRLIRNRMEKAREAIRRLRKGDSD